MREDSRSEKEREEEQREEERQLLDETEEQRETYLEERTLAAEHLPDAGEAVPALHYAGFWMRLWAYLLDLLVIGSLSRLLVYPVLQMAGVEEGGGVFSAENIAASIIFYLYFVLMTKWRGQTLGKMVFGLKVVPLKATQLSWPTVLFREWIGRYLSATIWILYVIVAFMPKKQGLHDYFADTAVIHERSLAVRTSAHTV
ncbi:RDD family protein [Bacillus thermotolerans]|uniref:RDD domain-containing protein n=1 Tax=Bacillus thermotolerans TaxID=1221996 RepID=A0A0F5ICU5_BACTR|nr:RDD family protein [Bacillus thermotolerans]KKB37579.1 hypothetical protein QY97_03942 [Bacillus thermotolerans]KKB42193.1 hypothetical protein QY96_01474 [Bacillus thermotolerans]KKB43278.1 hypothetical protein QY95_01523 [Bacillus thermotolerans]